MDSKFYGISLTCSSENIKSNLIFDDFEEDIVGPNNEDKAMYWIERTLEDVTDCITVTMFDMILNWLKTDFSKRLSFTIDGIGEISINKKWH